VSFKGGLDGLFDVNMKDTEKTCETQALHTVREINGINWIGFNAYLHPARMRPSFSMLTIPEESVET
jgi:hypothetical protein